MKFKYLGTAAAEGIPALWCNCDTCKKAISLGNKNIMSRSQAIIDDGLLVDFPPDTFMHVANMGKTLCDIENILITHIHDDHMYPMDMLYRRNGYAYNVKYPKTNLIASPYVIDFFKKELTHYWYKEELIDNEYNFIAVEPYKKYQISGYTIVPFEANHCLGTGAYIYLISKDGKNILYGNDTGIFIEKVDEYLSSHHIHIDLLSLDCTKGNTSATYTVHMSMNECDQVVKRFEKLGIIDKSTKRYYTHFSHNCQMVYDELVIEAKKHDFEVAFDGLEINL